MVYRDPKFLPATEFRNETNLIFKLILIFQVIENEDVYDRPIARSVCLDYDAVITNVENQEELDDINGK